MFNSDKSVQYKCAAFSGNFPKQLQALFSVFTDDSFEFLRTASISVSRG